MNKLEFKTCQFLKNVGFITVILAVLSHVFSSTSFAEETRNQKPNIILILADDMGYGDIGAYGNTNIKTPNLDAMAETGLRFTDFHSNGSTCVPTRASLLTGSYQQRVGVHIAPKNQHYGMALALLLKEVTFAEILKSAGYTTGIFGKWHLGDHSPFLPKGQGFDDFFGLPYSNDMHPGKKNLPPLPLIRNEEILETDPDQDYLTQRYTQEAIKFIRKNKNRRFLLYLAHSMPHRPIAASNQFTKQFTKEQLASINGLDKKSRDFLYPAAIEEIDWSTGEILKTLKELGIHKNTLVMFTSDNGPVTGITGSADPLMGGKGSLFEGGHRVPFIALWPDKIKPGSVTNEIAMTMDILPTMAEIAGARLPEKKIDGISLLPLLLAGKSLPERTVFWYHQGEKAARKGPWKLLIMPDSKSRKAFKTLYNLDEDIGEKSDLAEKYPAKLKELQAELDAWEKYCDSGETRKKEW
jgi:arylsulfatase A-like enzyme